MTGCCLRVHTSSMYGHAKATVLGSHRSVAQASFDSGFLRKWYTTRLGYRDRCLIIYIQGLNNEPALVTFCKAGQALGLLGTSTGSYDRIPCLEELHKHTSLRQCCRNSRQRNVTTRCPMRAKEQISFSRSHRACLLRKFEAQTPISTRNSIDRSGGCHGCRIDQSL